MEIEGIIFLVLAVLVLVISMLVICFLLRQKPTDTRFYLSDSTTVIRKKRKVRQAHLHKFKDSFFSGNQDVTGLSKTPTMITPSTLPSPINGAPGSQTAMCVPVGCPIPRSQTDNDSTDSSEYSHPYYDNLVILMCTPVLSCLP
eukprot:TRINITY_DN9429_c0_g2_i1.p1 TRINITY_DN9429_c0_g2~~TRINITY_DN9429_c0_g2_i1.p1  ORF type:complete len:144 (+),score=10.10 TRINITY_DN9429_c0_g2_i1:138-569(+)